MIEFKSCLRALRSSAKGLYGILPLVIVVISSEIGAQTVFSDPKPLSNFDVYLFPDQCATAVDRVIREIRTQDRTIWDTMPSGQIREVRVWPEKVARTAASCSDRWDPLTVAVSEFGFLYPLYLTAGKQEAALKYRRRSMEYMQAFGADSTAVLIRRSLDAHARNRPVQIYLIDSLVRAAEELAPETTRNETIGPEWRAEKNWELRRLAIMAGDSSLAMIAAQRAEKDWLSIKRTADNSQWYSSSVGAALLNNAFVHHKSRIEALKVSVTGYMDLVRKQERKVVQGQGASRNEAIGTQLPPIEAKYWFPEKPVNSIPESGKISLVLTLNHVCAQGVRHPSVATCHRVFAQLRRIASRFPSLDIVILSYIEGFFQSQYPVDADKEAELKRAWLMDNRKLPGVFAIEDGASMRLPAPDNRIIDLFWTLPTMNAYTHGLNERRARGHMLLELTLIDRAGQVLWSKSSPRRDDERMLLEIIEVLTEKEVTK